jgi:hypothetical protein
MYRDRFLYGGGGGVGNNTIVHSATNWLLTTNSNIIIVVADVKTKNNWVDVAVTPEEQETEDWLGKDIENAVESSLRIGVDDVTTLRKTPGNWVQEPQEDGPDTAEQECTVYISAENKSVLASNPDDVPCNTEKGDHAKNIVSPLVRRYNESTNKTGNNHDLIEKQSEQNCWPWETFSEEEI